MFNTQQAWVQSAVARSRLGVWCTLKISNQCKAILGRHMVARLLICLLTERQP
jgi:hypothetical protein